MKSSTLAHQNVKDGESLGPDMSLEARDRRRWGRLALRASHIDIATGVSTPKKTLNVATASGPFRSDVSSDILHGPWAFFLPLVVAVKYGVS